MVLFIWQEDRYMVGMVQFIDECLERMLYTSDQPCDGWKDVMNLSLSRPRLCASCCLHAPHKQATSEQQAHGKKAPLAMSAE